MKPIDMRNAIAAQCGFKDSKAVDNHDCDKCGEHFSTCICPDWPTIEAQEQYWKDNDIGGNVLPDRIQANEDTFSESSKIEFFQEHGELPPDYLREYDGAAEHYAKQGKLPEAMGSPGALDYINADPEAFHDRVREFKYAIAMDKTERERDLEHESRVDYEQDQLAGNPPEYTE